MAFSVFRAARLGDLSRVQMMLADSDAHITDANQCRRLALLYATMGGSALLPTLIWLLEEGGACITQRYHEGFLALLLAAMYDSIQRHAISLVLPFV
jgi:hypothetical protein